MRMRRKMRRKLQREMRAQKGTSQNRRAAVTLNGLASQVALSLPLSEGSRSPSRDSSLDCVDHDGLAERSLRMTPTVLRYTRRKMHN